MDYISALIEACKNRVNLLDSGKIPEDVTSMIIDLLALIETKADCIENLKSSLEVAKTDEKRNSIQAAIKNQSKGKQQLEEFFSSLSERLEAMIKDNIFIP